MSVLTACARMCGDPHPPGYPWVPIIATAVLVASAAIIYWWVMLRPYKPRRPEKER